MVKLQKDVIQNIYNTESTLSTDDENQSIEKIVKKQGREIIVYSFVSAFGRDVNDLKKQLRNRLAEGELHAYVELISEVVGIHPMITLAIFGVLKKDRGLMINSATEFSSEFGLSKNMCVSLTDLCIEEYMPKHFGVQEPPQSAIMKIKPLFRIFLNDFNQDFLEGILGIVLERNMNRMVTHFDQINNPDEEGEKLIPLELFHLLLSMRQKNRYLSQKTKNIVNQVLKEASSDVCKLVCNLIDVHGRKYKYGITQN